MLASRRVWGKVEGRRAGRSLGVAGAVLGLALAGADAGALDPGVAAGDPVAVDAAALILVGVVRRVDADAVLAGDALVAQAHVLADLAALEAVGARAEVEVRLLRRAVRDAA